ncbi:N-acetyl-gamma-glutamyl-phosphate reductase [Pasteurellaceae bacterium RH1A]|nr:N-acetyl-gamma-glutamyl-phosphate reductase [Pasteurellaceae bacterium RH1A]
MAYQVFVDGAVGTTGLRIYERLSQQADIEILSLGEADRKSLPARLAMLAQADVSILCLPDEASRELVAQAPAFAKICDTSTAFRTHPDWVYGLPELTGQREKVQAASRVAVPGCHATGFISLIRPLIEADALQADYSLACQSLTGYSGGGKAMIADYQAPDRPHSLSSPRLYGLGLQHKHLPEMQALTGLASPPIFMPVVADYYSGLLVTVPLPLAALKAPYASGQELAGLLQDYYQNSPLVKVQPLNSQPDEKMLAGNRLANLDGLDIFVFSQGDQILLAASLDNLGKGASGAAVQCMNLMLGRDEVAGLNL